MFRALENRKRTVFILTVISITLLFYTVKTAEAGNKVIIFHAGSLSVPFAEMEKRFEERYPDTDIIRKAGGSTKMARMISEQNQPADIMASADFAVIDKTLIPEKAAWNIRFASNQLVLCFTDQSQFAKDVTAENWFDILKRKGVVWGHSDPNLDPCGYRSLMVMQLAEKYYKQPGLYDQMLANLPPENVKSKATELVALLKDGKMDYAWEYLSVAVQNDLKFVKFDDHINLGNYNFDEFYGQAKVTVTGKTAGTTIERIGKSCTYGLTLIKDSPNPSGALLFLQYVLDPDGGLTLLKSMGQPPFIPARVPNEHDYDMLPSELKKFVEVRQ
jgi:molybdate/tungstate transport system substrate-binding protein